MIVVPLLVVLLLLLGDHTIGGEADTQDGNIYIIYTRHYIHTYYIHALPAFVHTYLHTDIKAYRHVTDIHLDKRQIFLQGYRHIGMHRHKHCHKYRDTFRHIDSQTYIQDRTDIQAGSYRHTYCLVVASQSHWKVIDEKRYLRRLSRRFGQLHQQVGVDSFRWILELSIAKPWWMDEMLIADLFLISKSAMA